jgi:hypothetical protein
MSTSIYSSLQSQQSDYYSLPNGEQDPPYLPSSSTASFPTPIGPPVLPQLPYMMPTPYPTAQYTPRIQMPTPTKLQYTSEEIDKLLVGITPAALHIFRKQNGPLSRL